MMIIDKDNEKAVEELQKLKETGDFNTLIIFGWVGVWKTFLVKHIFDDFDYFIDEPTFKQHIVSWNARLRKAEEYGSSVDIFPLEALSKYKKVIYDDYWTADITSAYVEKMLYWINNRVNKMYKTIITTNLTFKQFEERERRIASRLMEKWVLMEIKGKDRRKKETRIIKV